MVGFTIGTEIVPGAAGPPGAGPGAGGVAQAASNPRIAADKANATGFRAAVVRPFSNRRMFDMWVILLEAFGAMLLLILIVWWTMFSGRKRGERGDE